MTYVLVSHSGTTTIADIEEMLNPSVPLHAAHIARMHDLARAGERYSNEHCDVLGAAWQLAKSGRTEERDFERSWIAAMLGGAR